MPKLRNSSQKDKDQSLAEVLCFEPNREKTIDEIIQQLHAFEKKYRMRSEIFFKLFVGTPLERQDEFHEWAICYRQYFKILQNIILPKFL
ncbi:hypothetical protein L0244_35640 [bacterium]|nr:hypothetical protein [bacterium]